LLFDHQHPLGRQINHLAAFHLQALYLAQISLALLALLDPMHDHRVGRRRQQQRASWVTKLSPRLLAAALAQTPRLSVKAIRGRRQMAIVTVFLELFLQRLHLLTQLLQLVLHLGNLLISLRQLLISPRQLFLPLTLFSSQL